MAPQSTLGTGLVPIKGTSICKLYAHGYNKNAKRRLFYNCKELHMNLCILVLISKGIGEVEVK